MGELTKSVLKKLAQRLKGVSFEEVKPSNAGEFESLVEEAIRPPKDKFRAMQSADQRNVLEAAFTEATDEFSHRPGKGGYLALDPDHRVVGGMSFDPFIHTDALNDPALKRYFEELGAWPGELQYLSSGQKGVGTALFQLARARMLDERPDLDTVLMSLPKARSFYEGKIGMTPMEARMSRMRDPEDKMWFSPLSHWTHSLPPWDDVISEYQQGGKVDEEPPPPPRQKKSVLYWAGIRG